MELLQNIPCPHAMRVLLPECLNLTFVPNLLNIHSHGSVAGRFKEQSETVQSQQRIWVLESENNIAPVINIV